MLAVSICPQSLPYFAAKFNLSVNDAAKRLCGFLKSLGKFGFMMVEQKGEMTGFLLPQQNCFLHSQKVPFHNLELEIGTL